MTTYRTSPARDRLLTMIRRRPDDLPEILLTTSQVALLLRVSATTVKNHADFGRLKVFRTLGGHRRFSSVQVLELLGE